MFSIWPRGTATRDSKHLDALNRCRGTRQFLHRLWPESVRRTLSPLGKVRFRLDDRKVADLVAAYESGLMGDQVGPTSASRGGQCTGWSVSTAGSCDVELRYRDGCVSEPAHSGAAVWRHRCKYPLVAGQRKRFASRKPSQTDRFHADNDTSLSRLARRLLVGQEPPSCTQRCRGTDSGASRVIDRQVACSRPTEAGRSSGWSGRRTSRSGTGRACRS
jgi:hypothetical protein